MHIPIVRRLSGKNVNNKNCQNKNKKAEALNWVHGRRLEETGCNSDRAKEAHKKDHSDIFEKMADTKGLQLLLGRKDYLYGSLGFINDLFYDP